MRRFAGAVVNDSGRRDPRRGSRTIFKSGITQQLRTCTRCYGECDGRSVSFAAAGRGYDDRITSRRNARSYRNGHR